MKTFGIFAVILIAALFLGACADGNISGDAKGGKGKPPSEPTTECNDKQDNDGDGQCDYAGCTSGKGKNKITFPPDTDCTSGADDSEAPESVCGNGVVEPGEECDDGNATSSCSASCEWVAASCYVEEFDLDSDEKVSMGDGAVLQRVISIIDPIDCPAGKVCDYNDDGNVNLFDISKLVQFLNGGADCPFCGDADVHEALGEECDDGNNVSGDGCSASCQVEQQTFCVDNRVGIRQAVGDVVTEFNSDNHPGLERGTVRTDTGYTQYEQTLTFGTRDGGWLHPFGVNYVENQNDLLGDYLFIDDNRAFFEYEISFDSPISYDAGTSFPFLGENFIVESGERSGPTLTSLTLRFTNGVEFYDSDFYNHGWVNPGTVEINGETIEDAQVELMTDSRNPSSITGIKYRLTADASIGSTAYVPVGQGVREQLDEPEGMFGLDLFLTTIDETGSYDIRVDARNDQSYDLTISNIRGKEYVFPVLSNLNGTMKWGDWDDDFWFTEGFNSTAFTISDDDYFAVSENSIDQATSSDDSAIMRYVDIDTSDRILTFTDVGTGESKQVAYTVSGDTGIASNFVVEGNTYQVYIDLNAPYNIAIDLNGDGEIKGDEVGFTHGGGAVLDFGYQNNRVPGSSGMSLTMPASSFAGTGWDELFGWVIEPRNTYEIGLFTSGQAHNGGYGGSDFWNSFDLINDDLDNEFDRGRLDYGGMVHYYNPAGTTIPEEVVVMMPPSQVFAVVDVCLG